MLIKSGALNLLPSAFDTVPEIMRWGGHQFLAIWKIIVILTVTETMRSPTSQS